MILGHRGFEMMIAIAMVNMTLGFFLGYKVGYSRCVKQFTAVLKVLRKQLAKYGISLSAMSSK